MTEPARLLSESRLPIELSCGVQYVVDEAEGARSREIAGEFYPNSETASQESVVSSNGQSEADEQLARICELARRVGLNEAKTKMLVGRSMHDLTGLKRELLNQLDELTRSALAGMDICDGQPLKNETQSNGATTSIQSSPSLPDGGMPFGDGFLL